MAQIKGGLFAKGGSGTIISNNGAYFVDLTNATESSGTYTIPSADIENGDFTLQVGDTLIDKDSGSMLKVATLTPDITATLVYQTKQSYQHNITFRIGKKDVNEPSNYTTSITLSFITNDSTALTFSSLIDLLKNRGYSPSYTSVKGAVGMIDDTYNIRHEIFGITTNNETTPTKLYAYYVVNEQYNSQKRTDIESTKITYFTDKVETL